MMTQAWNPSYVPYYVHVTKFTYERSKIEVRTRYEIAEGSHESSDVIDPPGRWSILRVGNYHSCILAPNRPYLA